MNKLVLTHLGDFILNRSPRREFLLLPACGEKGGMRGRLSESEPLRIAEGPPHQTEFRFSFCCVALSCKRGEVRRVPPHDQTRHQTARLDRPNPRCWPAPTTWLTARLRPCCFSPSAMAPAVPQGEAGVGKTEIAKVLSGTPRAPPHPAVMLRGPRRRGAVYEWNYAAQMIAIRVAEAQGEHDRGRLEHDVFSERFRSSGRCSGARARPGRRSGAVDRRARPRRRGVRGLPARSAGRFPGDGAGARHREGHASRS